MRVSAGALQERHEASVADQLGRQPDGAVVVQTRRGHESERADGRYHELDLFSADLTRYKLMTMNRCKFFGGYCLFACAIRQHVIASVASAAVSLDARVYCSIPILM